MFTALVMLVCCVVVPLSATAQEAGSVFRLGSWSDMTTLDINQVQLDAGY
jgi:hypothetical protein